MTPFLFTYILLWVLVLTLTAAVFLLYRQYGRLLFGAGPAPEPVLDQPAPQALLRALARFDHGGTATAVGLPSFVVFVSEQCRACEQILPDLFAVVSEQAGAAHFYAVCRPRDADADLTGACAGLSQAMSTIADSDGTIIEGSGIPGTPFGLLLDANGIVRLKGIVTGQMLNTVRDRVARSDGASGMSQERSGVYA
jgi:hypothetical protein